MKITNVARMLLAASLLGLFGCGGGGGTPSVQTPQATVATATITGTVQFPSSSPPSGLRMKAATDPNAVYVQAYTLDGNTVGSQVQADSSGYYEIPDLPPGVDYVIKCTKGLAGAQQVLKKLIEKVDVAPGATISGATVDAVSTTAVVVASQKLAAAAGVSSLDLGEQTTLTTQQKQDMSAAIFTSVSPATLEQQISTAATQVQQAITTINTPGAPPPDLTGLTTSLVNLVNMLNLVSTAVSSNTDITKANVAIDNSAGKLQTVTLDTTSGTLTTQAAPTTIAANQVQNTVAAAAVYVPPARVRLDLSTNVAVNTMYGIRIDIAIPPGANVALDAQGYPDMSKILLAGNVKTGTSIAANVKNGVLSVLIASGSNTVALPTGQLASLVFDSSWSGFNVASGISINKTSDKNGAAVAVPFTLSGALN